MKKRRSWIWIPMYPECDKVKETVMKNIFSREYKQRLKLVLKSNLGWKNKILAINTWAVAVVRYGARVLKWWKQELLSISKKTMKWMAMNGALHLRSNLQDLRAKTKRGSRIDTRGNVCEVGWKEFNILCKECDWRIFHSSEENWNVDKQRKHGEECI